MKTKTSSTKATAPATLFLPGFETDRIARLLAAAAARPESAAALRSLLLALADALAPATQRSTRDESTHAPRPTAGEAAQQCATAKSPKAKSPAQTQIAQRREKFTQEVHLAAPACGMDESEAKRFADYWTESNPGGRKMRFEMERVFNMRRRMAYWMERSRRMHPGTTVGRARPLDATDLPATDDLLDG